jgi:hypothetical protein
MSEKKKGLKIILTSIHLERAAFNLVEVKNANSPSFEPM